MYVLGLPRRTLTPRTGPLPPSALPEGRSRIACPPARRGDRGRTARREGAKTPLLLLSRGSRHTGPSRRRRFLHGRRAHDLLDSRGVYGDDGGRHVLLQRLDPLGGLSALQGGGVADLG